MTVKFSAQKSKQAEVPYIGGVLVVCAVRFKRFREMYVTNTDHVVLVVLIIRSFPPFCSEFVANRQ
jgi:hypothetical protein